MEKGITLSLDALGTETMLYSKLAQYTQVIMQLASENEKLKSEVDELKKESKKD